MKRKLKQVYATVELLHKNWKLLHKFDLSCPRAGVKFPIKTSCRYFTLLFFLSCPLIGISQQNILLIGTLHQTERERLKEIIPVAAAVENFNPGVFCIEYPMPTDTASVVNRSIMHRNEPLIFQKMEALRKEWQIPSGDMGTRIELLQQDPALASDASKRTELHQLYFLSSDLGNADYQGYLAMSKIKSDTRAMASLSDNFPGFKAMKATFDHKCYADEYCNLVFPLAAKLKIRYLYPIDDLSTWKEAMKPYNRLHASDTTDADIKKFRSRSKTLHQKLESFPKDSNLWILINAPQMIQEILYAEGFRIDKGVTNEDVKLVHHYWVQRNKTMAQHIDAVARRHPDVNVVVFFGASHVGPISEELNKLEKNYRVITLSDITK